MATFHWETGGFDVTGTPTFNSDQVTSLDLPAGATLKKVLVRQTGIHLKLAGTDWSAINPFELTMLIEMVGGLWDGRELFAGTFDVPFETNGFEVSGVPVYQAFWHAGDRELAVNQRCSYFIGTSAPANVRFTTAMFSDFSFFDRPNGDWHMGYKIGYLL